jgi:NAD(P)-dependent dehydrogenase (short-subunit alcohol dehydrogenase family)
MFLCAGCGIAIRYGHGPTSPVPPNLERKNISVSDQVPLQSGFHAKSTAADVLENINLTGNVAIVTGGYSGLGLETVRALASKGTKVIVPVRSEAKAKEALADLSGDITTAPMDLADLASVKRFAAAMQETLPQLDLLINNAGVMASPESRVGPGWESQFGICHIGHFALAQGLSSLIKKNIRDARDCIVFYSAQDVRHHLGRHQL